MTGGKTCITGRSTRTCPLDLRRVNERLLARTSHNQPVAFFFFYPLDFEKNGVKSIAF